MAKDASSSALLEEVTPDQLRVLEDLRRLRRPCPPTVLHENVAILVDQIGAAFRSDLTLAVCSAQGDGQVLGIITPYLVAHRIIGGPRSILRRGIEIGTDDLCAESLEIIMVETEPVSLPNDLKASIHNIKKTRRTWADECARKYAASLKQLCYLNSDRSFKKRDKENRDQQLRLMEKRNKAKTGIVFDAIGKVYKCSLVIDDDQANDDNAAERRPLLMRARRDDGPGLCKDFVAYNVHAETQVEPGEGSKVKENAPPPEHYFTHRPPHPNCEACRRAKLTFAPAKRVQGEAKKTAEEEKATVPGQRILADLCGPFPTAIRGENTLLCAMDEQSGTLFLYPLRGKTPAGVKQGIIHMRERLRLMRAANDYEEPKVWMLKVDQGGEFTADLLQDYVAEQHGLPEFAPKGRHVAKIERKLRDVVEGIRAALSAAGIPTTFWPYAAITLAHNENCLNQEWREMCQKHRFPMERQVFGSLCFAKLPEDLSILPKSAETGSPCAFLGYSTHCRRGAHVLYLAEEDSKTRKKQLTQEKKACG